MKPEDGVIRSLAEFLGRLEDGVDIAAVRVTREETPDGPLHTATPVTLAPREEQSDEPA